MKPVSRLQLLGIGFLCIVFLALASGYGRSLIGGGIFRAESSAGTFFFDPGTSATSSTTRALTQKIVESDRIDRENAELRDLLKFQRRVSYDTVVANVVSRDILNHALVYLDVGNDSGVSEGDPVIAGDGILMGKILRVSVDRSLVEFLSSDSSRVSVSTVAATSTVGLLKGDIGTSMRLEYVLSDNLTVDDLVVTSGVDPGLPRGLLIGGVRSVEKSPNQLFGTAVVEPLVDYNGIFVVTVLKTL